MKKRIMKNSKKDEFEFVVYYDKNISQFRTIRGITGEGFIVSVGCLIYSDAQSVNREELLDQKYVDENLLPIGEEEEIEFFPHLQKLEVFGQIIYQALPYTSTLMDLEKELNKLLRSEMYEKACLIRDQIIQMKRTQKRKNKNGK